MAMASTGSDPWLTVVQEAAGGLRSDVVVEAQPDRVFTLALDGVLHRLILTAGFTDVECFAGMRFWALGRVVDGMLRSPVPVTRT